jgi:hypothetical protein
MVFPRSTEWAKRIITKTFNTTATVFRKTSVSDNAGGSTDSYAQVGTYACSFSRYPITPVEREATSQAQAQIWWTFVFAAGTVIHVTDRLLCNDRQFEVVSSATGSLEIAVRVLAQEIT